jgi:2-iminoacetate synthase
MRQFASWIEAHDEHASAHLPLLEQAAVALEAAQRQAVDPPAGQVAAVVRDRVLADRLERWRYNILKRYGDQLHSTDRRLTAALDLGARKLAGGPCAEGALGLRSPRKALQESTDPLSTFGLADGPNASPNPPSDRPLGRHEISQWFGTETGRSELVRMATELTVQHHSLLTASGDSKRTMFLYAPLYLSNHCVNFCDYCWFRYPQPLTRSHLDLPQVLEQAQVLRDRGMHHLLLVAGDYPKLMTPNYLSEIISALVARDYSVAIEIAPQTTECYSRLVEAGACGVTLYQETYNEPLYVQYHSRGTKSSFDWRLEGLDRAAEAGMRHLGMGVLLGLSDPIEELACTIRHGRYLQERFPGIRLSFGLPRLHDVPTGFEVSHPVDDTTFALLYCLLRIAFPTAHLVLSTRETEFLRQALIAECITQISAGSSTSPGGYTQPEAEKQQSEQFPISDQRSPADIARQLEADGYQVEWRLRRAES